MGTILTPGC
jgi:hypothetical protein